MIRSTARLLVLALVVLPGVSPAAFSELGSIPGGDAFTSRALGVSGDGDVVVGSAGVITYRYDGSLVVDEQAFRSVGGVMTSLSPLVSYHERSIATNASYDGSVVTGTVYRWNAADGGFRWTGDTYSLLGDFPGGGTWSAGQDVSADGSTIVGYSIDAVNSHAMKWESGTLENLIIGAQWNFAYGVSADGAKTAGFDESLGAIRWDEGVPMDLPEPVGSFASRAWGISSDGHTVVGDAQLLTGWEATRWDGDVPTVLGMLPGSVESRAGDVSGDGRVVVGYSFDPVDGRTATLWLPWIGIVSLYDLLDAAGDPVAGWTLREVTGVSDDGSTVVGWGDHPSGYERGFVATLPAPEPSFGFALSVGVLACAGLRRGRGAGASPCAR